ncbi:MAG: hypothetical protein ACR2HH_04145 [Chthoniobacterales bacterium]
MGLIRTKRGFEKFSDLDVSKLAGKTIVGFTGNPDLADPPVTVLVMTEQKDLYDEFIIKADKGGNLATARKYGQRAVVIDSLNKNASYVDIKCNDDMAILLSSGYEAVSTNRAQSVLDAPVVIDVDNTMSGVLKPRVKVAPNTKSLLGRIKEANGSEFGPTISFKNSRSILFTGLSKGVTYVYQLCAVGGSNGQSNWSDPSSGMSQ